MSLRTATICSVFFRPVDAVRNYMPVDRSGGWRSLFHIDAAKSGEFKTLNVIDHVERNYVGNKQYSETPVYADQIAACLVNEWANNVTIGNTGPGIFVCAGEEPTKEEIDAAIIRQQIWADAICRTAEEAWIAGKKATISAVQREAAVWLGRTNEYDWVSDRGTARVQKCPLCSHISDANAILCPNCKNVIDFARWQQYMDKQERAKAQYSADAEKLFPSKAAPIPPPVKNPQQQKSA